MRIAVAGKGGTGKTTIAGTLARALAHAGRPVLAIDADSNPNLAAMLGIPAGSALDGALLSADLLERRTDPDGTVRNHFTGDVEAVIHERGVSGPDGIRLLLMGRVGHSGAG